MIEIKKGYYSSRKIRYITYYKNGFLHREDGPAIIDYYKNGNIKYEEYWLNNKRHREDGPAYIEYDKNGNIKYKSYWLNNELLTEQKWFSQLSIENKVKFAFGVNND
jgi:antitoxin component YwqK of YwqJK toxin-antitoxin module